MSAPGVIVDTMANLRTVKDAAGKEYTYRAPDAIDKLKMVAASAGRARKISKAIDNPQTDKEGNTQGRVLPQHYEDVVGKSEVQRRDLQKLYKKGLYFKGTDSGYTWSETPF
jgi:uncharacterized caspase-like protein